MQIAGVILLLAAGIIVLFGGTGPRTSGAPLVPAPQHVGLLLP